MTDGAAAREHSTARRRWSLRIAARVADPAADASTLRRKVEQVSGGAARAAVLGVNDGLVTNLSLILGLAGADASRPAVRLAGIASLVAGAFSMAVGEWISMRSQVDLARGVHEELRRLVSRNPQLVLDELVDRLEQSGMDTPTAQRAAVEIALDEELFLSFTARNLFGLNPDDQGSPVTAAVSSLVLFSVGALLPLFPWFFTGGATGVTWTIALAAIGAVATGSFVGRSSGTSWWRSAARQLLIVAAAAAVTFGIGAAVGTTIG